MSKIKEVALAGAAIVVGVCEAGIVAEAVAEASAITAGAATKSRATAAVSS